MLSSRQQIIIPLKKKFLQSQSLSSFLFRKPATTTCNSKNTPIHSLRAIGGFSRTDRSFFLKINRTKIVHFSPSPFDLFFFFLNLNRTRRCHGLLTGAIQGFRESNQQREGLRIEDISASCHVAEEDDRKERKGKGREEEVESKKERVERGMLDDLGGRRWSRGLF